MKAPGLLGAMRALLEVRSEPDAEREARLRDLEVRFARLRQVERERLPAVSPDADTDTGVSQR